MDRLNPKSQRRLILASASPRRASLLREAGFVFEIVPSNIDEESLGEGHNAVDLARELAMAKARAIALGYLDCVVLAADTVVAVGDQILGKPSDDADARRMLGLLGGSTHQVITGVAVIDAQQTQLEDVVSTCRMKSLNIAEIDAYVASGEWRGKAGGYGLQDMDPLVELVQGCPTNIVGLPMTTAARMLKQAGVLPRTR